MLTSADREGRGEGFADVSKVDKIKITYYYFLHPTIESNIKYCLRQQRWIPLEFRIH